MHRDLDGSKCVVTLQLLQVLNAHMDSLQWIDSSALAVERKLGEVTRFGFTITTIARFFRGALIVRTLTEFKISLSSSSSIF